jgi:hypothetical protein
VGLAFVSTDVVGRRIASYHSAVLWSCEDA